MYLIFRFIRRRAEKILLMPCGEITASATVKRQLKYRTDSDLGDPDVDIDLDNAGFRSELRADIKINVLVVIRRILYSEFAYIDFCPVVIERSAVRSDP